MYNDNRIRAIEFALHLIQLEGFKDKDGHTVRSAATLVETAEEIYEFLQTKRTD
jgi:hypothetical protein